MRYLLQRPMVEFSLENRSALEVKQKREEKCRVSLCLLRYTTFQFFNLCRKYSFMNFQKVNF